MLIHLILLVLSFLPSLELLLGVADFPEQGEHFAVAVQQLH